MNFKFAQQINPALKELDFAKALSIAETKLGKIPRTAFHAVLGKSLVSQAKELAGWIEEFYKAASKKSPVKALYFEMNEFDINTDVWYIDAFAYDSDEGLDPDDMDWLSDFTTYSRQELGNAFLIQGYEDLQKAFEEVELNTPALQNAKDWCEQIVIARFMELMRAAHLQTSKSAPGLVGIPWYFTEHAYDFIVRSELEKG